MSFFPLPPTPAPGLRRRNVRDISYYQLCRFSILTSSSFSPPHSHTHTHTLYNAVIRETPDTESAKSEDEDNTEETLNFWGKYIEIQVKHQVWSNLIHFGLKVSITSIMYSRILRCLCVCTHEMYYNAPPPPPPPGAHGDSSREPRGTPVWSHSS